MLKLLYGPMGLVFGALGGLAANAVFAWIWRRAAGEAEAPSATDEDRGWREVLAPATMSSGRCGRTTAGDMSGEFLDRFLDQAEVGRAGRVQQRIRIRRGHLVARPST
jgi:uncharacterized protein DUF4235